jgi:ATP-dependent RNA helicase DeaD
MTLDLPVSPDAEYDPSVAAQSVEDLMAKAFGPSDAAVDAKPIVETLAEEAALQAPEQVAPEVAEEAPRPATPAIEEVAAMEATADVNVAVPPAPVSPAPVAEEVVAETPAPAGPFASAPVEVRRALAAKGFESMTMVQSAVVASDADGRDLQISSQTGSGKTIAVGFTIVEALRIPRDVDSGPCALIIVPTRELANQVSDELAWLTADIPGVRVQCVTGGTPVFKDHKMLRTRPRVLVGTPGRLLDHVKTRNLNLASVRTLVLDEADQMLDMGFREELEGILDTTPETRRTHMVSATFPQGIQRLAQRYQNNPLSIEGTRLGDANQDIEHLGHMVPQRERYSAMINILLQTEGERTLVFVERRADAADLAERLTGDGFKAMPLSGELAQSQRERTLAAFRAGRANVLVATDVAARGLDVPDVGTVIHTAPPIDGQVYTHRSGRTGRAGKTGRSILFASQNRRRKVERLLHDARVEIKWIPVPNPDEVHKMLRERSRAALELELDAALEKKPRNYLLEHANILMEKYEVAPLIATLLHRLAPSKPAQPERPAFENGGNPRGGFEGNRGGYDNSRGRDFNDRGDRGRPQQRSPRGGHRFDQSNSVRFFMNYGTNQGANPSRLLASICRRGEIDGANIGPIAIHPNASTFDVMNDVCERFERLAGRRDPRDPNIMIRRDRGPVGPPRGARREGPRG